MSGRNPEVRLKRLGPCDGERWWIQVVGVRTVMSGHVWGKDCLVCLGPLFLQLRDPLAAQEFAALCVVARELYAGWG